MGFSQKRKGLSDDIPLGSQTHRNSWEHEIQSLPVEAENHTRNSQQSGGEQVRAKN